MRPLILAAVFGSLAATAQARVVAISNPEYNCRYLIENMSEDRDFRAFMVDYVFGVITGLNIGQSVGNQPILDLSQIENNAMFITWTAQVCNENPDMNMAEAIFRVYETLWRQQNG